MSGPDRILLFIPTYNCARQVGRVIAQLRLAPAGLVEEVLVVDNGSKDDTVAEATRALAGIGVARARVVRNERNYHLGGSHKAVFAYAAQAGFSHVIVLHGDDQAELADVLPLLRDGAHRRSDALLGSRFMRRSRLIGYSRIRTVGNYGFNAIFTLATGRLVLDLGSGLNVYARSLFEGAAWRRYPDDLRFTIYLLLGMIDAGRRFEFFPMSWREEDQRSNLRIVSHSIQTLGIVAEYLFVRSRFRAAEHRATPHDHYRFEAA